MPAEYRSLNSERKRRADRRRRVSADLRDHWWRDLVERFDLERMSHRPFMELLHASAVEMTPAREARTWASYIVVAIACALLLWVAEGAM